MSIQVVTQLHYIRRTYSLDLDGKSLRRQIAEHFQLDGDKLLLAPLTGSMWDDTHLHENHEPLKFLSDDELKVQGVESGTIICAWELPCVLAAEELRGARSNTGCPGTPSVPYQESASVSVSGSEQPTQGTQSQSQSQSQSLSLGGSTSQGFSSHAQTSSWTSQSQGYLQRSSQSGRLRWIDEETWALLKGIERYGVGRWKKIAKDSEFAATLRMRSTVALKDKWVNLEKTARNPKRVSRGSKIFMRKVRKILGDEDDGQEL